MNEKRLQEIILDYFKKGDWNHQHTLAAAYWMKKLIEKERGNDKILITCMYLHDIGYHLKNDENLDERLKRKKMHMEVGAREAERILPIEGYTKDEIKQIAHLIRVHDKLKELNTKDEILVLEADSLAQIDHDRVSPSFNKEDFANYLDYFKKERASRFRTKTGKKFLRELMIKLGE